MSRLGGLGIQAFTNLSGNASRLMSQAFDRTLNSQQFLISQLENERQRKLQESARQEEIERQEDQFLENTLLTAGIGAVGGAAAGGFAAAEAGKSLASGIGQGALVGGLGGLPGGAGAAGIIANSSPLFNPQIGYNNARLANDATRLANDTLNVQSQIEARENTANYQRDKLKQDATQFATTNQRLLDTQNQNLAFKYQDLGATNDRFLLGETNKDNRQQRGFENSLSLEGVRQENRLGLEDARQGNRFDLADINNRADTTRALLLQDRIDERAQTSQSNSLNRPAIRGQQAGQALMGTLSNNAYRNGDGTFNQAGIDLAMSSLLDGDFGPELPSVLNALGQRGFPVSAFLEQKKRRDPSFNFNFGGLPDN